MAVSKAEKARRAQERADALEHVRSWIDDMPVARRHREAGCDGSDCEGHRELHMIVTSVSRSGMSRKIMVLAATAEGEIVNISYRVARALGWRCDRDTSAVIVEGCGMDMGFHLVYSLSSVLYAGQHRAGYRIRHNWL